MTLRTKRLFRRTRLRQFIDLQHRPKNLNRLSESTMREFNWIARPCASKKKDGALQHRPENLNRFSESTMRRFNEIERPLCVQMDARRSNASCSQNHLCPMCRGGLISALDGVTKHKDRAHGPVLRSM